MYGRSNAATGKPYINAVKHLDSCITKDVFHAILTIAAFTFKLQSWLRA